ALQPGREGRGFGLERRGRLFRTGDESAHVPQDCDVCVLRGGDGAVAEVLLEICDGGSRIQLARVVERSNPEPIVPGSALAARPDACALGAASPPPQIAEEQQRNRCPPRRPARPRLPEKKNLTGLSRRDRAFPCRRIHVPAGITRSVLVPE